jgi:endonuclease I
MKKLFFIFALTITAVAVNAQPQGYYNGTEGLSGNALKSALHNIIKNDNHVSYSGMWSAYQVTDKRPGTNYVWDIYSDVPNGIPPYNFTFVTDQCGSYSGEGDCYNREHLWAQSWTNNDGTHKTDLHHVYPTDGYVNGKRGNYAFGEVSNPAWISQNGGKLGSNTASGYNGTVFEPIDEYKGDIARALMYVSVRYYQEDGGWATSDMTNKSVIKDWAMTMLIRWHREDPVSEKEINRNNAVYGKQGNRNPFVDNMDFAELIWVPGWVGIEENEYAVLVDVWPNPATSTVNIKGENLNAVYIYNAMGQLILSVDMQGVDGQSVIDVSNFNSGIYFMNVITGNGSSVLKKVVVQ